KFLKTKSTYYHAKFKFYRNKLNHLIKLSKRSYDNNFSSIHVNQSISKIVWKNCEITDPKAIANAFNNYFANIGGNLASSIPSATKTA
ncbi:unnamed protein product, partial [Porites evermanni]